MADRKMEHRLQQVLSNIETEQNTVEERSRRGEFRAPLPPRDAEWAQREQQLWLEIKNRIRRAL